MNPVWIAPSESRARDRCEKKKDRFMAEYPHAYAARESGGNARCLLLMNPANRGGMRSKYGSRPAASVTLIFNDHMIGRASQYPLRAWS